MSERIKKVVKVTLEQWTELLKTGQTTDSNGNVHYYDETGETSYNVYGYDELMALNNKIDASVIRPNEVKHNPFSIEELETIIARLREEYNETDSVVGFRCVMKQGQQLKVSSDYTMYLNETLREYDYTCENDNEMISIVLFGTGENMNITSELIQFKNNIETYIEQKNTVITIETGLYITANLLTMLGKTLNTPVSCEEFRGNRVITTQNTAAVVPLPNVKRLKYLSNTIGGALLYGNTLLEEANFDTVTEISSNYQKQPFSGVANSKLVLNFPNLKELKIGTSYTNSSSCIFGSVKHLIIGDKLKSFDGLLITGSCGTVELYCKDATNSATNGLLAYGAAINYLYLCPEWNCPLNISQTSITIENITDIFNNLKDLTNETAKTLTIAKILYDGLDAETLAIAINKNWTIAY